MKEGFLKFNDNCTNSLDASGMRYRKLQEENEILDEKPLVDWQVSPVMCEQVMFSFSITLQHQS
jgi:hypothetical protein